jgi:PhzF family phenazine biosynthesis protein
MNTVIVYHYDAFSLIPDQGNPAGVVLFADLLSEIQMQRIASQVGFNETVFVLQSLDATLKLKYFTPGHEINLCGHATIAALFCLKSRGMLNDLNEVTIETNVGILPIQFSHGPEHELIIRMKQENPQFQAFEGDQEKLAGSIGLELQDLNSDIPIVYGSTGIWTLLIPIKKLESFQKMKPHSHLFPEILLENPRSSLHPFCLEAYNPEALMHARHFSSPFSGTVEDSITGTASGVMGAYYLTYINPSLNFIQFTVEQGQEINKDGRVYVEANRCSNTEMNVYVSGKAVFIKEITINGFDNDGKEETNQ